jgi:RNA-directed DNA polymerase
LGAKAPSTAFRDRFRSRELLHVMTDVIGAKSSRGVDRISPEALARDPEDALSVIRRKVPLGEYRFAPYLQILKTRGPKRPPRVISLATARDRVVLHQLKAVLHDVFPECIPSKLPNAVIREVALSLSSWRRGVPHFFRADIADFYGSIDHARLRVTLKRRIRSEPLLRTIMLVFDSLGRG